MDLFSFKLGHPFPSIIDTRSPKKYLEKSGFKVTYIENKNNISTVDYLSEFIKDKYQKINLIDPHDFFNNEED